MLPHLRVVLALTAPLQLVAGSRGGRARDGAEGCVLQLEETKKINRLYYGWEHLPEHRFMP